MKTCSWGVFSSALKPLELQIGIVYGQWSFFWLIFTVHIHFIITSFTWNPACSVSEIRYDEDLWQWSLLEIRLNSFLWWTIPKNNKSSSIRIIRNRQSSKWQNSREKNRFECLMKVLDEMTSQHKYLEKGEVQGSRKKVTTSVDWPKNLELASRYQESHVDFCESKGLEPWLSVQRITISS